MAVWNKPVITTDGEKIFLNSFNEVPDLITIKKIKFSSSKPRDLKNLKNLSDVKVEFSPSSVQIVDNQLVIRCNFNNKNNKEEYQLNTIGIYATADGIRDTLLAVITTENGDYIPIDNNSGLLNISFTFYLVVSNNANFNIEYNSSSFMKQIDVQNLVNTSIINKADKDTSVKSLRISNNTLYYSTNSEKEYSVSLPEQTPNATDTVAGKISNNTVKDLATTVVNGELAKYNIGAIQWKSTNLNDKQTLNGIFMGNGAGGINNKYTMALNMFYSTIYGAQLLVTEETIPRLYVRYYLSSAWSNLQEVVYKSDVATDTEKGIISKNEIKSLFTKATLSEIWSGVANE